MDPAVERGLQLVAELLALEIERMRATGVPVGQDEYRGLFIADSEADRLLHSEPAIENEGTALIEGRMEAVREKLSTIPASAGGPFHWLASAGLSAVDCGCLLVCLASESNLGLERLVAYAQDDVSKRRPRVEMALRLLTPPAERLAAREAFNVDAPLRRLRLITLHDEPGQPATPLLAQYVALDPAVASYLLGSDAIDEALATVVHLSQAGEQPRLPDSLQRQVENLAAMPATALEPPVVLLRGPDRARCAGVSGQLAGAAGLRLLNAELPVLAAALGLEHGFARAAREALLHRAALVLSAPEELKPEEQERLHELVVNSAAPLVCFVSKGAFTWPGVTLDVPPLEHDSRLAIWRKHLEAAELPEPVLEQLAGKFRLGVAQISQAASAGRGSALWRDPVSPRIEESDLYAAARSQSTPILNNLAKKVTPHYNWDDIVLAPDPLQQLREICGMVEHRHLIYDIWGFERKLAMGKGILSLFAGQSGTGKTMAADIIAGVLGLDMYKIDLSGIVSKYIGETEKNLSTIFAEAETSNSILFFDEADALFGKRSEVKDAHDRYANIETAYLLQRMEEYSGPVILSTNLKMNLDEAFLRRLHFVVDFPMPEEDERRRIWRGTIPPQAPLRDDIDFDFLARQFKISGGNIRNIVLSAAFLAAADDGVMAMRHLIRATRREFQKLGKMVTEAEFGPYIGLLHPAG